MKKMGLGSSLLEKMEEKNGLGVFIGVMSHGDTQEITCVHTTAATWHGHGPCLSFFFHFLHCLGMKSSKLLLCVHAVV